MRRKAFRRGGFTLLEVMVVLVILGILAALVIRVVIAPLADLVESGACIQAAAGQVAGPHFEDEGFSALPARHFDGVVEEIAAIAPPLARHGWETRQKGRNDMPSITETAKAFFDACETGKGWEGCAPYCTPDASFAAQAEPLAEVRTLAGYADWMKGLLVFMPEIGRAHV